MRPYHVDSEDFDDFEGFANDKTQSLQEFVKEARRERLHRKRHRGFAKDHHHFDDWDNDDDWDSYDDDSSFDYYQDLTSHY